MDRNEKQNSFRNTRRTRGESKSIQKLKRRLRLTTVFAVVMLAAFLGSLAWLKISNDASQKTIDEQRRDIAILNDKIQKMEEPSEEITPGAETDEVPVEITPGAETDEVPVEITPGAETDEVPVEITPGVETDEVPVEITPGVETDEVSGEITPGAEVGEVPGEITPGTEKGEGTEVENPEQETDEKTEKKASEEDNDDTVTTDSEVQADSAEKKAGEEESEQAVETATNNSTDQAGGETDVSNENSDIKQNSIEHGVHAIEALLDRQSFTRYQFAFERFTLDNLGGKPAVVTSRTQEDNVLEDVTSDHLQNLILLAAYEKRLKEINKEAFDKDAFVNDDSLEDYKLVLTILKRVDTKGKDEFSKEDVDAKTILIGRIGYSKMLEEEQGDISEYSDTTAAIYVPEGYEYIQDFLMDPAYFGDEACTSISEAKQYFESDIKSFSIEKGMSLLKHLTLGYNRRENNLWNYNNEIFLLDDRLAAKNIDEKPAGNLIRKKMDIEGSEDGVFYPFHWIEDTGKNDDGAVHSYVYIMFPCNDGNQWCVSALFIDGGELNEDQAGKYCDYLLEMAEAPAPAQEETNDALNNETTTTTPPPAENPEGAVVMNTNSGETL